MKEKNGIYIEIIAIIIFTIAIIFNAFLATKKYENRRQSEINRF